MTPGAAAAPRDRPPARPWLLAAGGIAGLVLLPIASLVALTSGGSLELWRHLAAYVLPAALADTAILLAGVGVLTAFIGAGAAWLVACYDFPARRVLQWALLLPLAVPTYIVAYAYLDILHPVGPVQTVLRAMVGAESPRDLRLPDVRSMTGCIVLLSLVLYPYVYLPVRAMLVAQSAGVVEAARTLGASGVALWWRIGLPFARPAVAAGVTLALLEALNDVGAAEFLGVRTLTVTIYSTWIAQANLAGAAQIAVAMLAVVVVLVGLERWARRGRGYAGDAQHLRALERQALGGWRGGIVAAGLALPVFAGFVAPALYLADAAFERLAADGLPPAIAAAAWNTLWLSLVAMAIIVPAAVLVTFARRINPHPRAAAVARTAALGYAVPGTVLAIGILPLVAGLDRGLYAAGAWLFDATPGLLLLGSGAAVVYAYVARFLAVALGAVGAGFSRVPASLDDASRTLGQSPGQLLRRVHVPLLRPAVAAGAILVLIDALKELPATLLLRPLGFETLSTYLYGEAARGTYEHGAIAALLIVVVGLVPVVVLSRR